MNLSVLKKIIPVLLVVGLLFVVHTSLFNVLNISTHSFIYPLEELYFWFTVFSMLVIITLLLVQKKSFDNVGMSFLLTTSVKMIFCYLIVRPVLQRSSPDNTIEKLNFFGLFVVFLAIETLFTIYLVNEKKK